MKVTTEFHCAELIGTLTDGCYDVSDGATAKQAMLELESSQKTSLNGDFFNWTFPIINGTLGDWETVLDPDSLLQVYYILMGG